jgi:hypothetical protein
MRFFASRVGDTVYQGKGGIYFITSEKFSSESPRLYTVRSFNPETGGVNNVKGFDDLSRYAAHKAAKELCEGGQ